MRLPPFPFTVLDTETTGFVPRVHRIIEFASVRVEQAEVRHTCEQLFSVPNEIPPHVQVLTRIRPETIRDQPTFVEKREEMLEHIGSDTLLVGQNLGYDIGMLKGEDLDLSDRAWVDTSLLASLVFPEFRSYSLQYMSRVLNLNHEPQHRALGDVQATLELLSAIWTRLSDMPAERVREAKRIMRRSSAGYAMFFDALPDAGGSGGAWLTLHTPPPPYASPAPFPLTVPADNAVTLQEESLAPTMLQAVVDAGTADVSTHHWIAVKNLSAALKRLTLPAGARVLYPPHMLLDPAAAEALLRQDRFTPEEALVALKLTWWPAVTQHDVSLHGGERDVWMGKLACTATSPAYTAQFSADAGVTLLDHWQLLSFLHNEDHGGHGTIGAGAHVVIDDASMLEDTATKAFGRFLSLDALRAAAQGDDALTRFTDLLSIWVEKIRREEDQHLFTAADAGLSEGTALAREALTLLDRENLPPQTVHQLRHAAAFTDGSLVKNHVVWSERRQDGSLLLHAAPEHVGELLRAHLFSSHPTTLLIPDGCAGALPEIIPAKQQTMLAPLDDAMRLSLPLSFPDDATLESVLTDPPPGKTILLVGSKRMIEQLYIRHTEALEQRGVTLICQGLSGGQNRMESEFLAADAPTVWLLTPWMYEGLELPPSSVDRLIIQQLPFDSPGHPVFSKRKGHYRNAFAEYALVRLQHRLFRLLRTFCRHRVATGEVRVIDARIREKSYGRTIRGFLEQFAASTDDVREPPTEKEGGAQLQMPL